MSDRREPRRLVKKGREPRRSSPSSSLGTTLSRLPSSPPVLRHSCRNQQWWSNTYRGLPLARPLLRPLAGSGVGSGPPSFPAQSGCRAGGAGLHHSPGARLTEGRSPSPMLVNILDDSEKNSSNRELNTTLRNNSLDFPAVTLLVPSITADTPTQQPPTLQQSPPSARHLNKRNLSVLAFKFGLKIKCGHLERCANNYNKNKYRSVQELHSSGKLLRYL